MKTILFIIVTGTALLAADPAVTEGMSNGRAWTGLGGGDAKTATMLRFIYLIGLGDGFKQGRDELSVGLTTLASASGQNLLKAAESTSTAVIRGLLPDERDFVWMIASLNEFYDDNRNLDIPIPVAARLLRAWSEGVLKDREEHLQKLRALYQASRELDSLQVK